MKRTLLAMSLMLSVLNPVNADILDVSDAALLANAIKQLEELHNQCNLLQQAYTTAQSQLDSVNQLKNANLGHYGYGNLSNSLGDLKNRQWSPNTWDDALQNIAGGNPARYQALVKSYEKNHITLDDSSFIKGASTTQLARYKQAIAVNKAASVENTYAYNDINQHLKAVHDLSLQIEKADNTKSAMDLNSRLLAEIAYIQVQNLKLQTLISQQLAQSGANDIGADSDMAVFNRLPDE